ncbi:hypothetical protein OG21DRAFT_1161242 [Imleria badia]|nr:hypothetical protein OG21DRAFT_1161242 [Imleria badia]
MAAMINVGGDVVSVGQFYAAMYWGFVLSTSCVGISLVQGYLYFMMNNKDRWSMKALVISLLIFDPATSLLMAQTIYHYFVKNFGVEEALRKVPNSWIVENGLTVLVTAMVQFFFASRVFLGIPVSYVPWDSSPDHDDGIAVNDTVGPLPLGRTAPTLVFVFALVAFAGTVRTVFFGLWSVTSFSRILFQTFVTIEESCALVSDIISSACLCYMLPPPHLGSMKRSEILKTMFMFTINRAILVSIIQIGVLSSYLPAKNYLYWMPFHLCKSKLYTNTLLAMLNSRSGESAGTIMFTSEGDMEKAAPLKENADCGSSLPSLPSGQPSEYQIQL